MHPACPLVAVDFLGLHDCLQTRVTSRDGSTFFMGKIDSIAQHGCGLFPASRAEIV
jgi:hypothetical protein